MNVDHNNRLITIHPKNNYVDDLEHKPINSIYHLIITIYRHKYWVIFVWMPTIIAVLYYYMFSANIYLSEAKYIVRIPSESSNAAASYQQNFLNNAGNGQSPEDTHAINSYLTSRDALINLQHRVDIAAIYNSHGGEFIEKIYYNFFEKNREFLYQKYLNMTKVKYDKTTGISTLMIYAYDPVNAKKIASILLDAGEGMANLLPQKMQRDMVEQAREETRDAREKLLLIHQQMTKWREKEGQVDPSRFSSALIEVVARLSLELAQLKAQYAEILQASPQNPSLSSLKNRIEALSMEIESQKKKLAGGNSSLAPILMEYETLQFEREIAEKHLHEMLKAEEVARITAQRQQIYLERIVEPIETDYPAYPYRVLSIFVIFVISQLFYFILSKFHRNIFR